MPQAPSRARLKFASDRYTPDFDRKTVEEALRLGGYPRFVTTIRNAPEVGQLVLGGGQPYAIRYARERVECGGRTIVVVTDRPVFFLGAWAETSSRERDTKWPSSRFSWTPKDRARGRWRRLRACAPMATAVCCLTTTTRQLITLTNITRKAS